MYVNRYQAVFIALTGALAAPCFAQSSTAVAPDEIALEEVVITGSRLASGFATPTPVTMVAAEDLSAAVPNNMGEALAQLPSLAGSIQNTTSGIGSGVGQNNGQNLLNLRRLGADRALILLDGQRLGVTNVVGSVDINIIPQNIVKRVDVVTGGASASYGSDAVAGAVNFVLDTTFEGLKVDVNAGITDKSDAENGKVSVAFGKQLSDRARVVGALEYYRLNGLKWGEVTGRDWYDRPTTSVQNVAGQQPTWVHIPDARSRIGSFGGTVTAVTGCPAGATGNTCRSIVNQRFTPGGGVTPFNFGTNNFRTTNNWATGGDGPTANQTFLPTEVERQSLFLHGELDLNDHVTLWAQGSYNASNTFNQAQVLQVQTANQYVIFEDNAYLPAAITQALGTVAGTQSFSMTRYNRDMGFNEVTGNVKVIRFATGLKGSISDTWSYDTAVTLQDTHQDLDIRTALFRNLYAAADAVRHPTTNQIVCRSQWYNTAGVFVPAGTGLDPGCVPSNLFGDGSVSQAATDYVMGLNTADVDLKQTTFDANIRGDLGDSISLGAGPISVATGMNYRRLTAERKVDAMSNIYKDLVGVRGAPNQQGAYGGYTYYNPTPFTGRVSVTEGYVEFGVPLLRDLPMVQDLSTTLAGRVTDYSQSGVENMWKLGLNWTMNNSVRFRGTLSADTRAPNIIELFDTGQVTRGNFTFPSANATPSFAYLGGQNIDRGNPELRPERARTYTAGFVLSPSFLPGFQASIDWYRIDLLGAIGAPGTQTTVNNCYAGIQASCALITVNGQAVTTTANITSTDYVEVINPALNEPADQTVSGLDIETAYKTPVGSGDLTLRLTGNIALKDYDADAGCAVGAAGRTTDFVGAIGNCGINPKIRGRISANYDIGPFGIYVQERYIDKGKLNPNYVEGINISENDVPAVWYTDLTLSYALGSWRGGDGEVYLNVTNVLDKEPPPTNSTAGRSWIEPTETELYDALGRRYVLGMRYKW